MARALDAWNENNVLTHLDKWNFVKINLKIFCANIHLLITACIFWYKNVGVWQDIWLFDWIVILWVGVLNQLAEIL